MNRKDRVNLDRSLMDLHYRAGELARHVKILADVPEITGEDAWKFAFRTQEDMRALAASLLNISRRLVELQCERLRGQNAAGEPTLTAADIGSMTVCVLRDYFGCQTPMFAAMYAVLASEAVAEDDPAVADVVNRAMEGAKEAETIPFSERVIFVDALSLVMSALAARATSTSVRVTEFVSSLESMLRHLSRPDVALELLNQYGDCDAVV